MTLKTRCQGITRACGEALTCLALALRSSLRPGILLRSSLLCLIVFGLWTWAFYSNFQLISIVSGAISLFVVYGAAVIGFVPGISGSGGASVAGMGAIAPALATLLIYAGLLAVAVIVALYTGMIILSIRLMLRWVLMGSLRQRALRQYPHLQGRTPAPGNMLRGARYYLMPWLSLGLGPLLCLLIPFVNGMLLMLLLAYLNVRFLSAPALAGLASGEEQLQAIRQQRGAMAAFGLLIFVIALVPVLNLLVPALLGAGTCHLAYRGLERTPSPAGAACVPQVSLPPL
ncbi:EI24 domain-containing protein [Pseudomonas sp. MPFS]|uniref:EI24 domain-containing protein n=1 Tax=Pseudomonas sp. MPFS TaxID=2795724 RepID=UPI001F12BDE9|nr:EI24 domain-containing protein [Pseudomonas sp. MPFS]UMZ12760.1 EI24 domain-containing protein [Pseudomonas sp. MPFS]